MHHRLACFILGTAVLGLMLALPCAADEPLGGEGEDGFQLDLEVELQLGYRSSDSASARTFTDLPDGPASLTTVEPGDHFEVSEFELAAEARWGEGVAAVIELSIIDLYDWNPTSENELDLNEAWLRFGRELQPGELADARGAYVKLGKFGKFERQDERPLVSYGLASTTFNRIEDVGVEVGVDVHPNVYLKLSAMQGNDVFFRDPNALAGDTSAFLLEPDEATRGGGLGLIYDAEREDLDFDDLELGAGFGLRFADASGQRAVDILLWGYQRDLAPVGSSEDGELGRDLDLLTALPNSQPLAVDGDRKEEIGLNIWLYSGALAFFGQYVDAELAGLPRRAYEAELAYTFDLPARWATGRGEQVFSTLTPAVRYSRLFNDFEHPPLTLLPSLAWDWYKLDVGVSLAVLEELHMTVEYSFNHGYLTDNNEFLWTFSWQGDLWP